MEVGLVSAVDTHDIGIGLVGIYHCHIDLIIRAAYAALALVSKLSYLLGNYCLEALRAALGTCSYGKSTPAPCSKFEEALESLNTVGACARKVYHIGCDDREYYHLTL